MVQLMSPLEELMQDREIAQNAYRYAAGILNDKRQDVERIQAKIDKEMKAHTHTEACIEYNQKYEHDTPGVCICDE